MRLIAYVAVMFLIIFSLFYMLSHIWYLLTPPMELFTVKSFKVNGKRIDKMCDVVRIGGEYLIPVVAVNERIFLLRYRDVRDFIEGKLILEPVTSSPIDALYGRYSAWTC